MSQTPDLTGIHFFWPIVHIISYLAFVLCSDIEQNHRRNPLPRLNRPDQLIASIKAQHIAVEAGGCSKMDGVFCDVFIPNQVDG